MARLHGLPEKYGTIENICVYPMYGEAFMRGASSLTGERVKSDPAFKKTMDLAGRMGIASRLAAAVYAMLPPYRQQHKFYRILTGLAMKLLNAGNTEGAVVVELMIFIRLPKRKPRKKRAAGSNRPAASVPVITLPPPPRKKRKPQRQGTIRRSYPVPVAPVLRLRYMDRGTEIHRFYG